MDLLAFRDIESLEERVHVLPAVQLAKTTELSLCDGFECVPSTIAVDQFLYMCRLDLATMVDDFAGWIDQSLSQVECCMVDLGKPNGDIAATPSVTYVKHSCSEKELTSDYPSQRGEYA